MLFECGCYLSAEEDGFEACCPIHNMPMKVGTIDYADLVWAQHELSVRGMFSVDDLDDEG